MLVKTNDLTINFPAIVDAEEDGLFTVSDAGCDVLVDIVRHMPRPAALNAIKYVLWAESDGPMGFCQEAIQSIYDAVASSLHNRFIETYEDSVVMERNAPKPVSQGVKVYCVMSAGILTGAAYLSEQACRDEAQRIKENGGSDATCVQQASIKDGFVESVKDKDVYVGCDDSDYPLRVFSDWVDAENWVSSKAGYSVKPRKLE